MKKYKVRINFVWDYEYQNDTGEFIIVVPNDVTVEEIEKILSDSHNYLCDEDEDGWYDEAGREPETLLNYVCEKYGWKCEELEFDIDMEFD